MVAICLGAIMAGHDYPGNHMKTVDYYLVFCNIFFLFLDGATSREND